MLQPQGWTNGPTEQNMKSKRNTCIFETLIYAEIILQPLEEGIAIHQMVLEKIKLGHYLKVNKQTNKKSKHNNIFQVIKRPKYEKQVFKIFRKKIRISF